MRQAPRPPAPDVAGPIDVRRALRESSRPHPLRELARSGPRSIEVLSKSRIAELINRAVRALVERSRDEDARRREKEGKAAARAEEARSFRERLGELVREVEGMGRARAELEAARGALVEEIQGLREDLEREKTRAAQKREDALDRSPYLGVADFDRELAAIVARVCRARAGGAAVPPKEGERVEAVVRDLVLRLAREERGLLRPPATDRNFWRMEKRVEKLYSQLDELENAIRLVSSSKVQSPQVQNALRELGLLSEDKYREKKREMLKVVLDTNREIRLRHRELAARGVTLSAPGPLQ